MPSVAIFTYSIKPRGSVVHAACLAEALAAEGADVTLYALAKGGDRFFRPLRCPLVLFPAAPAPSDPERLIEQRIAELHAGLLSIGRHDIYHAEDCLTASALLTATPRPFPVVRTVHHVEAFESSYLAACQRRSIERANLLFSVSGRTAREVRAEFGRTSVIAHNGVDLERFRDPPASLAALGLPDAARIVLSVGGVGPRKNALRMLEALASVLADDPSVYWVVAGGASIWDHSEHERDFDARVAALPGSVRGRILRTGEVAEATLTALYQRSLVLVCASLSEGWGLCALEALAAGTPVVASAREPFTEFLDRSVAVLVDPESTRDIADGVSALLRDPHSRSRLAASGRACARLYSWQRSAWVHLQAYRTLLGDEREGAEWPTSVLRHAVLAAAEGV
jgi:glycosyltransferase-like protein